MSEKCPDYLNANGLVQGLIPEGKGCPFLSQCGLKNERCPTEEKPVPPTAYSEVWKMVGYSCGAARAHSMVISVEALKKKKV